MSNASGISNTSGMQSNDTGDLQHDLHQFDRSGIISNSSANGLSGRKHARPSTPTAATEAAAAAAYQQQLMHQQRLQLQQQQQQQMQQQQHFQHQQHLHMHAQNLHLQALMAQSTMISGDATGGSATSSAHALVTGSGMSMMSELHTPLDDASEPEDEDDPADADETEEDDVVASEAAGADATAAGASASASPTNALPPSGAKRMRLTLGQKREVVDLAASKKFTHRELAEQFNVGRTTITNICRQEDLIRTETDSADAVKKQRKTTKFTYDMKVLDECLHKWRMEMKVSSPDTRVTGTVLQQRALELSAKILQEPFANLPDKVRQALAKFTASNGWLDGYRMRFGSFTSKTLVGNQSVIKTVDLQTRLRELHHSLSGVELQDIWTGSEFAIVTKPGAAAVATIDPAAAAAGGSTVADCVATGRFTLALFASAAGEVFDLQVIGVDRSPAILESVDVRETFRIEYGHSKTGCQVAHTTVAMLKALNALAKTRKRTFRVVLDSAVPHVKAAMILDSQGDHRTFFVFDHLQIYFLPPNVKPPRCHPCHLGLVQAFKARFRCELVESLYSAYRQHRALQQQHDGSSFEPLRYVHTRNVFHWFHVALRSLDKRLVQTCWVHSGLLPTQALVVLNMKEHAATGSSATASATVATGPPGNADAPTSTTTSTSASSSAAPATTLPSAATIYRDLQTLLYDVALAAPDFLQSIGVTDPSNAQAYAELEGHATVSDSGVDEAQIIRSVLQKNDFLHTKRLDDAVRAAGQFETPRDVADEPCPHPDQVLAAVNVIKQYVRLAKDAPPDLVDTVVQLNKVKAALRARVNTVHIV